MVNQTQQEEAAKIRIIGAGRIAVDWAGSTFEADFDIEEEERCELSAAKWLVYVRDDVTHEADEVPLNESDDFSKCARELAQTLNDKVNKQLPALLRKISHEEQQQEARARKDGNHRERIDDDEEATAEEDGHEEGKGSARDAKAISDNGGPEVHIRDGAFIVRHKSRVFRRPFLVAPDDDDDNEIGDWNVKTSCGYEPLADEFGSEEARHWAIWLDQAALDRLARTDRRWNYLAAELKALRANGNSKATAKEKEDISPFDDDDAEVSARSQIVREDDEEQEEPRGRGRPRSDTRVLLTSTDPRYTLGIGFNKSRSYEGLLYVWVKIAGKRFSYTVPPDEVKNLADAARTAFERWGYAQE